MVVELVGAFLFALLQVLFDRIASRPVVDFFRCRKFNDGLLRNLKETMRAVNRLLNDAEEKQITDSDVKDCLHKLKDALYEAEDCSDEIAYDALRFKLKAGSETSTDQVPFSSFNPFNKSHKERIAKLEEICQTLQSLLSQRDDLGLREVIDRKPLSETIPKTSLPEDSEIFGRRDDKKAIVELLLSPDANGKNIEVIVIVGMAGIGKTTLAQHVAHDNRVQEWFDIKPWVYVSREFDCLKKTKDLLKEVGTTNCDSMTPNQLHLQLEEKIKEKKVVLFLDDAWNDHAAGRAFLLTPLKFAAQGSKIVVTTRNESVASAMQKVASSMQTVSIYRLNELTYDSCWLLFSKCALLDKNIIAHSRLEAIGREIVRKCGGLPLAARTLGGLLCSNRDAEIWEKILKSKLWNLLNDDVLPALKLSYHFLPSHLKRCFGYCAIFPKGHKFEKEELTLLWMAELGSAVQPKDSEKIEEMEDYFDDLVSRSLFQRSSGVSSYLVMHDLINDLAEYVSGEFFFKLEDGNSEYDHEEFGLESDCSCKAPKRTRYLSYPISIYGNVCKIYEGTHEIKHLRTFLPLSHTWINARFDNKVLHDLLKIHKRLRVLSWSKCFLSNQLPNSLGSLKHLRYLNLSQTSIERLPETVSSLFNLQTLILRWCEHLMELPPKMSKLINLQHLDIRGTNLKEMPSQMGKLIALRKLTDFVLGKQSGSSAKELGKFMHLRDKLSIWNLHNVIDSQETLEANLKGKKQLEELELTWEGATNDSQHERDVLEKLEPCTNVKKLGIFGYGSTRFPNWIGDSSCSNIVELVLSRCKCCLFLPPLGQLPSLKDLRVEAIYAVEVVGPEFYGSYTKPFGSLKILRFEDMPEWCEWISDAPGAFPLLEKFYIEACPNLTNALPGYLPSLSELDIQGCPRLSTSILR